jgi:hypothetical protein
VTVSALLTAPPFMNVVIRVTGKTGGRRILMRLILMAPGTSGILVPTEQREVCDIVIERHLIPVSRVVTIHARLTERTIVGIVSYVAAVALKRCFPVRHIRDMATVAFGRIVFPEQLEVG